MQEATAQLEARLERNGGGTEDWELLAKSYEFLGRPADAARARQHVVSGSPMSTAEVAAQLDAAPAEISGTISIESRLASRVDQGATLFIYAKAADSPGPPLAVMRVAAGNWPVSFLLDDSMSMLPSRRLSQFQKVVVEARVSRSGQATPAAGDLYVTSDTVNPGSRKKLALVINHEIG
jgi:cytochrome c-type biogenesis protein CcmH